MKRIVVLSDLDVRGSGYSSITIPLVSGLVDEYEVKAIGLGYKGEEHYHPFSILPAQNFQEVFAIIQNLYTVWTFDLLIVALDIPLQNQILHQMHNRPFKYIGILPIEADPLCMSWAMVLMMMDKVFIISEFGQKEAEKVGVDAEWIQIGVDTESWRFPTDEEKSEIRNKLFGITDNKFVVLTVADNQERKNLSRSMQTFYEFSKTHPDSMYVLVTREHQLVGWNLRDYAQELGMSDKLMIFERGLSFKELWSIYAGSDCFLLTSKAEGMCAPVMEAVAVGLPVAVTKCTALNELIAGEQGYGIRYEHWNDPEKIYRDPFGNGRRYFADLDDGVEKLKLIYDGVNTERMVKNARNYVERRTWDIPVKQLKDSLAKILGE